MRVKFTDRQQQAWKILPDGIYPFEVVSAAIGYSASTLAPLRAKDALQLEIGVWESADAYMKAEPHATTINDEIVYGALDHPEWGRNVEAKMNTFLRTIGWTRPDGTPLQVGDEFDLDPTKLVGRTGRVHLKSKTKPGQDGKERTYQNVYIYVADRAPKPALTPTPPKPAAPKPAAAYDSDDAPF